MLVAAAVDVAQAAPPPTATVRCRNIRQIDTADFERRLRLSSLFTAPADTVDAYADPLSPPYWMKSHRCVIFADG